MRFVLPFLLLTLAGLTAQVALPDKVLLPVEEYSQKYSLSCESAAAGVVLRFLGRPITEDQILAKSPYEKAPKTVAADGTITWGDPNLGFVGDYNGVYLVTGYGIYAAPLAKALEATAPGKVLEPGSLDDLERAAAAGVPSVVWVPTRFEKVPVRTWKTPAGKTITWIEHEHAMVFRGYDRTQGLIHLMDVHNGKYQTRTVAEFLRGWGYLGNQAIVFDKP